MKIIYTNDSDFRRITKYLKYRKIKYILSNKLLEFKIKKEELFEIFSVVVQYLNVSQIKEIELKDEGDDINFKIVQLKINTKRILKSQFSKKEITSFELSIEEIRSGMIVLNKQNGDRYNNLMVVLVCDKNEDKVILTRMERSTEISFGKVPYVVGNDLVLVNHEFEKNGRVDITDTIETDNFDNLFFAGYLKREYYNKILNLLEVSTHFEYPDFIIGATSYDFELQDNLFNICFREIPAIRCFDENYVLAMKRFLRKIGFESINIITVFIFLNAIKFKQSDIVFLVKEYLKTNKISCNQSDFDKSLKIVLKDYNSFLLNVFSGYNDEKYISINEFISFIIKKF